MKFVPSFRASAALVAAVCMFSASGAFAQAVTALSKTPDSSQWANSDSNWPLLSADGNYAVFNSLASNLTSVPPSQYAIYRRNIATGQTVMVNQGQGGAAPNGPSDFGYSISADGGRVVFSSNASNLTSDSVSGSGDV
jgi:hypothetical protein